MNRSKQILIVCHCVLNANAKVYPLAGVGGVFMDSLGSYIESGCGLFQLPCPETTYLGMNRWGMTKEQYDHANFRAHCREILKFPLVQLQAFAEAGYELTGVMGMDGSPNCGVNLTCEGYEGGELGDPENIARQLDALRFVTGKGVFMIELLEMLQRIGIRPDLLAIRETSVNPKKE
jgi:predicted secreted protein